MSETPADKRLAENEVVFRAFNRRLKEGLDDSNIVAAEEGEELFALDGDTPLHFVCECSNLKCHKRIRLTPNKYDEAHRSPDQFIVIPGHELPAIESIVETYDEYLVVKKHIPVS